MRLLLLALAAIVVLPQVIPAYGGQKKCWSKLGHCKKHCTKDEVMYTTCKNHRVCCIPGKEHHKSQTQAPDAFPTTSDDSLSSPMDFILTVKFTTVHFQISTNEEHDEKSSQRLQPQTTLPTVHQSS
ncbi:beta-defensin 118 [Choloepus didactylus]|uniref:beta-defensin 118 n=1 Tax=Choloepus didactylus TaxID=27675 RepID=UPI0001F9E008|nr:beta-defensin 118 [Choloepus didactylus]